MLSLRAGDLNRKVVIRLQTDTPNVVFGITQTFAAGITCWAKVEAVGGAMFFGTKQTGEEVTHRVYVRRYAGTKPEQITSAHVVEYDGRRYRVMRASAMQGDEDMFTKIEVKDLGAL